MRGTVLIVDDLVLARRTLARELERAGFQVVEACNGDEAWEMFTRARPAAVVTDLVMPGADGQALLERIRAESDDVPVLLFSAKGGVDEAVSALKAGADDFIASVGIGIEDLVKRLAAAIAERKRGPECAESTGFESRLVGPSDAMHQVRRQLASLAPLRAPVLVIGEPGTGRDAAVQAIHDLGSTAGGELARVDCRSICTENAFPPCDALYLDHVDQLPVEAQRPLEAFLSRDARGDHEARPRILASTSEPRLPGLNDRIRARLLRLCVELPTLRTRPQDVPDLSDALVRRIGDRFGRRVELTRAARLLLASQSWPGNVSQLAQVIERVVAFSPSGEVRRDTVERALAEVAERVDRLRERRETRERIKLLETLRETEGNVTHTAERLGKSRAAIYRMIERFGITLSAPRSKG